MNMNDYIFDCEEALRLALGNRRRARGRRKQGATPGTRRRPRPQASSNRAAGEDKDEADHERT